MVGDCLTGHVMGGKSGRAGGFWRPKTVIGDWPQCLGFVPRSAAEAARGLYQRGSMKEEHFAILRRHIVEVIGICVDLAGDELGKSALDERVLTAMGWVPRHAFVPPPLAPHAYQNLPLPIGFDKTISQPFIVAVMTDLVEPRPGDVVLEIGTGLGYQAAILGQLVRQVWSVEIIEELAVGAEERLRRLGYDNIGSASATAPWAGRSMRLTTRSSSRRAPSWCRRP